MVLTFSFIIIDVVVPLSTEFYQTIYFLNPIIAFLIFWGVIDGVRQIKNYNQVIAKYNQLS